MLKEPSFTQKFISLRANNIPYLYLGEDDGDDNSIIIDIRFCPFCGVQLLCSK